MNNSDDRSISAKVEELAKILRREAKQSDFKKKAAIINPAESTSATNKITVIALLLRKKTHELSKKKQRSKKKIKPLKTHSTVSKSRKSKTKKIQK